MPGLLIAPALSHLYSYPAFSQMSGLLLSTDKHDASCHSSAHLPMHYLLRCSVERTSENCPSRQLGEQRQWAAPLTALLFSVMIKVTNALS